MLLLLTIIAACGNENGFSKTYTVDELLADEALLTSIYEKCRANPGELRQTPNCVNASAADHKMRVKKERENLAR